MKISIQWLKEFTEIDLSPKELADRLTMVGLEVEGLSELGQEYDKVVVGEILEIQPHGQVESLKLCRVDVHDGRGWLEIVCGAPNLSPGDRVPVALPGAVLEGNVEIRVAQIKGRRSEGMICSQTELGLGEGAYGAMILPQETPVGQPLADALGLKDTVLEVNVTPNRSDCLSILGIAREVAAITGTPLRMPGFGYREEGPPIGELASVQVEDPERCPRYTARLILGVQIQPSPVWVQKRLRAVGLRPINNVVDVTNYVLIELGQPLHAFDFDLLAERRIVVRRARPGEEFVSLDGVPRPLDPEMLVIADGEKASALGGIIGGWESQVRVGTQNILLESAYFDPLGIRRTSKRLGLQTDASYRFERGIDPEGVRFALDRAADLISYLSGGKMAQGAIDCYVKPIPSPEIRLRPARVNHVLGTSVPPQEMVEILGRLGMRVGEEERESFRVVVPSFRQDLTREVDLIEEIARHHGYDRVPTTLPRSRLSPALSLHQTGQRIRGAMLGCGLTEVINYSFIREEWLSWLGLPPEHPFMNFLSLRNPLSQEGKLMRTTLLPGLIQNLSLNFKWKAGGIRVFELGRVFWPVPGKSLPQERRHLAGAMAGITGHPLWEKGQAEDFFTLKGIVETLLDSLHLKERAFLPSEEPYFHPKRSACIEVNGQTVGHCGELRQSVAELFDLTPKAYLFELDCDRLASLAPGALSFRPLPRYPAVYRDLAVIVDNPVPCRQVEEVIRQAAAGLLARLEVFDLYTGEPVPPGKKSLAFSLTFQAEDRTLTDEEVNEVYSRILTQVQEALGGSLRA
ncbi:MAG: phenylalanine--tRNA ligase subunit beta [Candidatus Tectomicrobia bacterium]|uniref:Phenylalanine--tRNA ligase beta subunit n=1 Tax=Tectimicrobiota bacterium TaxID=2528274 RepID=A0A932CR12_UNCTE|nr:phenylalanine--tRNA ligase subunit beta [Candidatus Tectomicrobia bacterium]